MVATIIAAVALLFSLSLPVSLPVSLLGAPPETIQEILRRAQQGKVAEAIEMARRYIQEHPDDPAGRHALGRMLYLDGNYEEAVVSLGRCLEMSPEPAWMVAWSLAVMGHRLLDPSVAVTARRKPSRGPLAPAFHGPRSCGACPTWRSWFAPNAADHGVSSP